MKEKTKNKHLSLLRSYTLADVFTLLNGSCGTISIFLCLNYVAMKDKTLLLIVFLLLPVALGCDLLDGYLARRGTRKSLLGADLDSLADIISFGVAPAVLGFTLGLRGLWDILLLTYFVVCGISRLARFNVTLIDLANASGKVKYFEGTPIPTSMTIVILLGIAFSLNHVESQIWLGSYQLGPGILHPFTLLYALNGSTMISATLKIPKP
ncbi:MAG: CDP-alcohol phosphatidyltransferase family protein [Thermodesulfobacteriota bacterium]